MRLDTVVKGNYSIQNLLTRCCVIVFLPLLGLSGWAEAKKEFPAVVANLSSCAGGVGLVNRSDNEFLCVKDKPNGLVMTAIMKHKDETIQIRGVITNAPDQGLRMVQVDRLNGQKIHDPNAHGFGFSDALMMGAMGMQGVAAANQTNAALRQQQIAQMQAEQAAYTRAQQAAAQAASEQQVQAAKAQQAAAQAALQQQSAPAAANASTGTSSGSPAIGQTASSAGDSSSIAGCGWPSDFDLIRDPEMLKVIKQENFTQQLQGSGIPIDQQITSGEQLLAQLQGSLTDNENTIRGISSPTITHFNFHFDYEQKCKLQAPEGALMAAECQQINLMNTIYATNGTLRVLDCMSGKSQRASIGSPQDMATPEDELPSQPSVASTLATPAAVPPPTTTQGSCQPKPGDTICR